MQNTVVELRYARLAVEHRPTSNDLSALSCAAFLLLRQARLLAESANCDVWDFAVELEELRRIGVTVAELRWLLIRGFVRQAWELAPEKNGRRRFDDAAPLIVRPNSCFVMTDAGLSVARGLAERVTNPQREFRRLSSPAESDPLPTANVPARTTGAVIAPWPFYDAIRNEFFIGQQMVKRFRSPAPNQQGVLAAFQALSWPDRIEDPLPATDELCPRRRLSETIRALNRHQSQFVIRFCGDGSGRGVLWERVS